MRTTGYAQSYLQQALLPKYESKLKASLKNLDQALDAKNAQKARTELSRARAILEGVSSHFPKRTNADAFIEEINELQRSHEANFMLRCEMIMSKLRGEVESIELLRLELQWRRRDAG